MLTRGGTPHLDRLSRVDPILRVTLIAARNELTAVALFRGRGLRHGCEKNDRPISLRNGSADPMHPGANERRRGRTPPHDPWRGDHIHHWRDRGR